LENLWVCARLIKLLSVAAAGISVDEGGDIKPLSIEPKAALAFEFEGWGGWDAESCELHALKVGATDEPGGARIMSAITRRWAATCRRC
jgi:hypothetical protein